VPSDLPTDAGTGGAAPALNVTGRVQLGMVADGHRTGDAIKAEIERTTRLHRDAGIGGISPGPAGARTRRKIRYSFSADR